MFRVQVQNIRGDQRIEFHVGSYTSFYWIGLHSVGLHTSCHWIVRQSIGSYISCHWIGGHVIRSETSFDRASGFLKKVCFPECFSRYVSTNMAAYMQGKHRTWLWTGCARWFWGLGERLKKLSFQIYVKPMISFHLRLATMRNLQTSTRTDQW